MIPDKLSLLVASPSARSLGRIRQILKEVLFRERATVRRSLSDVRETLSDSADIQLVILTISFGVEPLNEFLRQHASVFAERKTRLVLAIDEPVPNSSSIVAGFFLAGVSGFISEPFAVEDLSKLLELVFAPEAADVDSHERLKRASSFLAADAMSLVDQVAVSKIDHTRAPVKAKKQMENVSRDLNQLFEQNQDAFVAALVSRFEKAQPFEPRKVRTRADVGETVEHPGLRVAQLIIMRQITPERLTELLRRERGDVDRLLNGDLEVTEGLAQSLSRVLGGSPRDWLAHQLKFNRQREKSE